MRTATPLVFGALLVGLLAAGCSSEAEDTTTTSSETTVPAETTVTTHATTTSGGAADAGCVGCHTDQTALQAMAVEPIEAETLSEGEG